MSRFLTLAAATWVLTLGITADAQPTQGTAANRSPAPVALSLVDALRAAQPASEPLAAARADVERARAQVTVARSRYFPQVDGNSSYVRTLRSEFDDISFGMGTMGGMDGALGDLPFGQPNTWRVGATVAQPIFEGFRTGAAVAQAKAGVRASQLGLVATRAQVVAQVAQAYFDASLAVRQVEIAEVTLQQAEQTVEETQLRFEQGTAPEFDLVRAQVSRDNQNTLLVRLRTDRDVAFVLLRRLIGSRLDQPLVLTTGLETEDVEAVLADARSAAGLPPNAKRIAVAQAREVVAIQAASVRIARADLWPVIAAVSDLGFVNYQNQPFNEDWRTNWTIGINLTVPIFDGWRRRGQVQVTRANLAASQAQLADVTEISQVDTARAAANVAAAKTTLETTTRTVALAKRAYEIAELRFQQGASSHLELVDARVQLEQSQLNQARSARDLRVARIEQELLPGLPLGSTVGLQGVLGTTVGAQAQPFITTTGTAAGSLAVPAAGLTGTVTGF